MKGLTKKQDEILKFICEYTNRNSCPPTVRETAANFGVSPRAIQDHFFALEKKGYLSKIEKQSRSVKVVNYPSSPEFSQKVPILGTIAAGKPIFCEENFEDSITLSYPFIKRDENYFALYVRGKSMINAGINDGDLAIIKQQNYAHDGQIVVALLEDSVTLKRFFREPQRVRLEPANPEFGPIFTSDVMILGVLSHIIREY